MSRVVKFTELVGVEWSPLWKKMVSIKTGYCAGSREKMRL